MRADAAQELDVTGRDAGVPTISGSIVRTLGEAFVVRRLRNSCREYLTNDQEHLGWWRQCWWYFFCYRQARKTAVYRLYLFYDAEHGPVGYGALRLRDRALLVTEGVAEKYRGRGFGRSILAAMVAIARQEKREVVAEIWADNVRSIRMHEQAGFVGESISRKGGRELRRFLLQVAPAGGTGKDGVLALRD